MPILIAMPPSAPVEACATPPQTKVLVTAKVDPWDVGPTVDMANLERMAQETGQPRRHGTYGFYSGDVAYAVTAENADRSSCWEPITIHITMRLANRHIGVAKDMLGDPCQSAVIVTHYRHHAEADEAVFRSYVTKVMATLTKTEVSSAIVSAGMDHAATRIPQAINAVIGRVLTEMDVSRAAANVAVDTPSEIKALEITCVSKL